jgi:GT2 family glycosyltransferase/glycosyltransferase involved in cell wall biosynthesis/ubiquinone/menaquinone biosynthesis C-methylase UbiE
MIVRPACLLRASFVRYGGAIIRGSFLPLTLMTQTRKVPESINTGERMIPDAHRDAVVYAEHVVRYMFAAPVVREKRVLDVASGSGYGCEILAAAGASEVVGIDYSPETVRYSLERHSHGDPRFTVGDAGHLPFADDAFDVVVSFETIEHVRDPIAMLHEVKRVLKPNGLFLVSTPNKGVYIEGNEFHLHEFTYDEFEQAIGGVFQNAEFFPQDNWLTSSVFTTQTHGASGDALLPATAEVRKATGRSVRDAVYVIAVCSDGPLPEMTEGSMMAGTYEMKTFVAEIERLTGLNEHLKDENRQRKIETANLKRDLRTKQGELEGANRRIAEIEGSIGWRALNRARPVVRKVAPRGSLQFKALRAAAQTGITAARMARRPFVRGPGAPAEHASNNGKPRVRRLRVGCYGEHCWTVGGGTVHALQLLLPLLPYFQVELLLPPSAPLRDRKWYLENMQIDIGKMKVSHYSPGAEDTYDVWLSVWNEKLWPAKTPKSLNLLFFPFVELDGEGFTHIVNSEYTARHGRKRYHSDDMVVIPPYVDVDTYKTGPKEGMILHCSRFALPSAYADKAHVMMIQAFKQLVDRGLQGWKLVFAGATIDEGEEVYKDHLQKHAYGYPVEFKTNLPADELRDLFARASVYWHATGYSVKEPAAQEHFGIVILEGMASGAVPVVYNSGGPPEIITNGKDGFLFDTLEEMVEDTWQLATEPERWRKMSMTARERAGYFSPELVKERMLRTVSGTEKVSIIIGSHNNREVLTRAIDSVLKYTPPGFELIAVDQACTDGTSVYLASLDYPHLKIIRNTENKSFAEFNNQGLELAARDYILHLNDDIEAFPGWIEPLIDTLDRYPRVGAVGSRLLYPDGRVQHDGKMFKKDDLSPHHVNMGGKVPEDESALEVDALTAACIMVRRELAGFSEDYIRGYYEDTDLCLRIKEKGYALVLHRGSVLIHYHGMSFGKNQAASEEAQAINRKTFLDRWRDKIPDLVYLASEDEMKASDIRCKPLVAPEDRTTAWPISKRLVR